MSFASISHLIINGVEVTVHNCDGCSTLTPLPNHYCDACKANGTAEKDMQERLAWAKRAEEYRKTAKAEYEAWRKTAIGRIKEIVKNESGLPDDEMLEQIEDLIAEYSDG